jgi:hypothetical protein
MIASGSCHVFPSGSCHLFASGRRRTIAGWAAAEEGPA